MVKRLLGLFSREYNGLHQAALLLGFSAFVSQLLALLRDRLLAHYFGAGTVLDVYYAAFRIPDFLYISVASFVSLSVLIPLVIRKLEEGTGPARRFLDALFTTFFLVMVLASVAAFFLIPQLADLVVPGFDEAAREDYILLSRILLLSPILLGLSNLAASITQSFRQFLVYAASPVLYNLGIICGIVFFYPAVGLAGLVLGVLLGAALHLAIQLPVIWRLGLVPAFTSRIDFAEIGRVAMVSLPRTLALGAHQLVILILVAIASTYAAGSIAVFNFSFNLQSVPLSIIGVSYSVAAFPTLARLFSGGEREKFLEQIVTASRQIIFWSLPIMALLIILRAQIVRVILGSGMFGWTETRLVAAGLALFALSGVAQSLNLLFTRGYYAAGVTKKPLLINLLSSGVIIVLALALPILFFEFPGFRFFFEALFRVLDLGGTEVLMLPLSFTLGLIFNWFVFWVFFQKDFARFSALLRKTLAHSFYAAVFTGLVSYLSLNIFDNIFDLDTFIGIFLQGLLSGLVGIAAGTLLLKLLKNKELADLTAALHHKFWQIKPPPAPTPEETQVL